MAMGGVATPRATAADELGIETRAGFGLGSMASRWQRDRGYTSGFVPDLRPGLRLDSSIAAELAFASWFFPRSNGGTGRATFLGAGGRWDPQLRDWLTWFVDGHVGLALTGPANRFMFDTATGFDVWISRSLGLGPYLRYGQVVGHGVDPKFWAAGLSATMTWASAGAEGSAGNRDERQRQWERERQSPRRPDRDHDDVVDEIDVCPDEPAGSRPDPNALGCPRQAKRSEKQVGAVRDVDSDRDGVPDRDDKCPDRPFGQYPDPVSMGCPLPDRDHDGVPDALDSCPDKRGKPSPSQRKNGCGSGAARRPFGSFDMSKDGA